MNRIRYAMVAWITGVVMFASGCGTQNIHPVTGKVFFPDGKPLTTGRVVIDSGENPVGSWGQLQDDGTFVMGTHTPSDGVPAGTWRVTIQNAMTSPPPNFEGEFVSKPLIDPKYFDPETSGLVFEVPPQQEWNITVTRP